MILLFVLLTGDYQRSSASKCNESYRTPLEDKRFFHFIFLNNNGAN